MPNNHINTDTNLTSKFYMIRCIIAMAHADGEICDAEQDYISRIAQHVNLTPKQRNIIDHDLNNQQDIIELFNNIEEPQIRGQAIDLSRILALKDGVFHPTEKELLAKVSLMATNVLNMEEIRPEAKHAAEKELNLHHIDIDKTRLNGGLLGLLDQAMLTHGIDLISE